MLRNKEQRFNIAPSTIIERSTTPYKQKKTFTFKMAELIPFFCDTLVMPSDSFKLNFNAVCRLLTPINPTMDDLYLDVYFYFVPYRLVFNKIKEFFGENPNGAWVNEVEYLMPKLKIDVNNIDNNDSGTTKYDIGSVWDYIYGGNIDSVYSEVNACPARAYVCIYNEWFRDQNWIAPKSFTVDDSDTYYDKNDASKGGMPFKIAKYHDLYTSLLPAAQKGTAVTVPLGQMAIVKTSDQDLVKNANGNPLTWSNAINGLKIEGVLDDTYAPIHIYDEAGKTGSLSSWSAIPNGTWEEPMYPRNLYADLSSATAASINSLREAFAYQRIMEKMARGGSRYVELVKSIWGATSSDARLQIPEYLGGKSIPLSMMQVPQTSETTNNSPLGNLAAYSHTVTSDRAFTKSFTEHGIIMGLLAVRQQHSYQQGLEKCFTMFRRYDFYWPQLAHLGEQPVLTREIFNTGDYQNNDDIVLGFNEAWYQYRYRQDTVAGYMRSGITGSLDIWHYADFYENAPTISEEFINETDTYLRRTLAVTDNETHQFLITTLVKGTTTRPMPTFSIPGLLDHF